MAVGYTDTYASIAERLSTSLSSLAFTAILRVEGVALQEPSTPPAAECFLTVEYEGDHERGEAARVRGSITVDVATRPDSSFAYRKGLVIDNLVESLRGATIAVDGGPTGAPSTVRGHIQITSVRVTSLGATSDHELASVDADWIER